MGSACEELMEMLKLQISLGAVSAEEGKIAQQVRGEGGSYKGRMVGTRTSPLNMPSNYTIQLYRDIS